MCWLIPFKMWELKGYRIGPKFPSKHPTDGYSVSEHLVSTWVPAPMLEAPRCIISAILGSPLGCSIILPLLLMNKSRLREGGSLLNDREMQQSKGQAHTCHLLSRFPFCGPGRKEEGEILPTRAQKSTEKQTTPSHTVMTARALQSSPWPHLGWADHRLLEEDGPSPPSDSPA